MSRQRSDECHPYSTVHGKCPCLHALAQHHWPIASFHPEPEADLMETGLTRQLCAASMSSQTTIGDLACWQLGRSAPR